jgi:hypothetical protein
MLWVQLAKMALPKFNIKITTQFLILPDPSVHGLKNGHKNFSKAQSSEVRVRIDQSMQVDRFRQRMRRSPGSATCNLLSVVIKSNGARSAWWANGIDSGTWALLQSLAAGAITGNWGDQVFEPAPPSPGLAPILR